MMMVSNSYVVKLNMPITYNVEVVSPPRVLLSSNIEVINVSGVLLSSNNATPRIVRILY